MHRLIAALAALAVAACSPIVSTAGSAEPPTEAPSAQLGSQGALPSASTPPTAGASPTAAPSPTARVGTFEVIPPGAAIEVAVAELNLRAEPKKSAAKVETLKKGDVLVTLPYDRSAA